MRDRDQNVGPRTFVLAPRKIKDKRQKPLPYPSPSRGKLNSSELFDEVSGEINDLRRQFLLLSTYVW